jgi:hypothetical protein
MDPGNELSRAEAEVEQMRTADDVIFYLPEDIRRGLGLQFYPAIFSTTMNMRIARCIKKKLRSEEELEALPMDPSRAVDPKFERGEMMVDFYQPMEPADGRYTVIISGIDPARVFGELRECMSGSENPSMPGGRKTRRRRGKKTLRRK